MTGYTLVSAPRDSGGYEALYSRGQLIATSEDGPFTAAAILEAIAMDNISVKVDAYVEVSDDYDQSVVADHGWPDNLDDIPAEVRT